MSFMWLCEAVRVETQSLQANWPSTMDNKGTDALWGRRRVGGHRCPIVGTNEGIVKK